MKKILAVILAGCMMLSLAACGSSKPVQTAAETETAATELAAETAEETTAAETAAPISAAATPESFKELMEENQFYVQQGAISELDTIEMASQGKLMSCFGNNAGSVYTVLYLPPAPEQDPSLGNPDKGLPGDVPTIYDNPNVENYPANPFFSPAGWQYKLRADEALVIFTKTPPECKYYSFINYIMFTQVKEGKDYTAQKGFFRAGNEEVGFYHPIFGSIGSSVNFQNVNCDGEGTFSNNTIIIISANQTVTDNVVVQLKNAGYSENNMNIMTIPEKTYRMGLEKGADTFCLLGRISQPADQVQYEKYIESLTESSTVYRLTPMTEIASAPYENETTIPRGTGVHEIVTLDDAEIHLNEIRNALIAQYGDEYDYEELSSDIAVPEGLTAYLKDCNAQGDNKDTSYVMTADFKLNSDDDFIVVYGINHTKTGKAQYSNAVLYARPMLNGVCSVYDSLFEGTANAYLEEGCEDASSYYVYKMARTQMDDNTSLIEYSTGNEKGRFYGVDNGDTLFMTFRAYVDETGVGASYYEIAYDRTIVFHKKGV